MSQIAPALPAPVLPVVVLDDEADAVPLARALVAGGLPTLEITLRTAAALGAVGAIAANVPDAEVGAGTVLSPAMARDAVAAGARFLVTPGSTPRLLDACQETGVPYLPGAATASEALALWERGVREIKFFPAEAGGGAAYLRALAGPLPDARFCPTGGVTAANAGDYLALPNVDRVGGTWMVPADTVAARDWARVTELAARAAALGTLRGRPPQA